MRSEHDEEELSQPVTTVNQDQNSDQCPEMMDIKREEIEIFDSFTIKQEDDENFDSFLHGNVTNQSTAGREYDALLKNEVDEVISQNTASLQQSNFQELTDYKEPWLMGVGDQSQSFYESNNSSEQQIIEAQAIDDISNIIKIEFQHSVDVSNNQISKPISIEIGSAIESPTKKPICFTSPDSDVVLYVTGLRDKQTSKSDPPIMKSIKSEELIIDDTPEKPEIKIPDVPLSQPAASSKKRVKKNLKSSFISEWGCHICNRMFRNRGGLIQHNNSHHSGDKPFVCRVCGKRFFNEDALLQHELKHEKADKPFKCNFCTRQYIHSYDLRRHVVLHHTPDAPYICRYCSKAFDRNDHVKDHEISHENGTVKGRRKNKKKSHSDK
ncbi:zinc finger and BTB domain-containing protein 14-like isoform X2 [Armigeres subalbatus]